jgi:hypothetical protein
MPKVIVDGIELEVPQGATSSLLPAPQAWGGGPLGAAEGWRGLPAGGAGPSVSRCATATSPSLRDREELFHA